MKEDKIINRAILVLLLCSFVLRAFVAGFIELGNDEVYYWTYAKFPDWSHFDHPPMVGWVIQLFTLNLRFDHEFFLRLGAVVFGTLNTWLIFLIGRKIKDSITGFYAALLFTASIYCFIVAGTFIMPDTPQVLFWLLSLWLLVDCLPDKELTKSSRIKLLLAGVTVGLALLSKYHSAFLIVGVFLYMLFYNRNWFKAKETYLSFLIALVLFAPVIIWNYQNSFISFTFHEARVGYSGMRIRWDYFGTELIGQFFYSNPVNFIIILFSLVAIIFRKQFLERSVLRLLLVMSLPLALVFMGFSLYSSTLPHWTGPAYLGLILVAAAWLSGPAGKNPSPKLIPLPLRIALIFQLILITAGVLQIKYGIFPLKKNGIDDITMQMQGWKQLGEKFRTVAERDINLNRITADAPILTFRWFPAANLDYYVAGQLQKKVYSLGTLSRIHKYYWIDKARGDLLKGTDAYYIALSNDYVDPHERYGLLFDSIVAADTLKIFRGRELTWEAYVFKLYGLKKKISFRKVTDFLEPANERINYWINQIRTHPDWLRAVTIKAQKKGATLDDVMWDEASWVAEQELHK
ncbi:MAG: glycosyltransferase family 39 protein [Bacteroidales bacterium]|jgi:4-amino-4-deoxy-L-arabinose transferase-like glycosyltransferase